MEDKTEKLLRAIYAAKASQTAPESYFERVEGEFHRRLAMEVMSSGESVWSRLLTKVYEAISLPSLAPSLVPVACALVVGLFVGQQMSGDPIAPSTPSMASAFHLKPASAEAVLPSEELFDKVLNYQEPVYQAASAQAAPVSATVAPVTYDESNLVF